MSNIAKYCEKIIRDTLRAFAWLAHLQDDLKEKCGMQERVWSLSVSGGLADHIDGLRRANG